MRELTQQGKFRIAMRDQFTCQFCGSTPGNDRLEIGHLIPLAKGGSDHDSNLITTCRKCNRGKSDTIALPEKLCIGIDQDGWKIHKAWGKWAIKFDDAVFLTAALNGESPVSCNDEYAIEIRRVHEPWWHSHIGRKPPWYDYTNFCAALEHARRMVRSE